MTVKSKVFAAAFASVMLVAGSASAQAVVSPAPSDYKLVGDLALHQTAGATCKARFDVHINSDGRTGQVTAGTFDYTLGGCGWLIYPRTTPWNVEFKPISSTQSQIEIDINDVFALAGTCVGKLTGTFDEGSQTVDFALASVVGSSPVCTVDGVMDVTPDTAKGTTAPLQVL